MSLWLIEIGTISIIKKYNSKGELLTREDYIRASESIPLLVEGVAINCRSVSFSARFLWESVAGVSNSPLSKTETMGHLTWIWRQQWGGEQQQWWLIQPLLLTPPPLPQHIFSGALCSGLCQYAPTLLGLPLYEPHMTELCKFDTPEL